MSESSSKPSRLTCKRSLADLNATVMDVSHSNAKRNTHKSLLSCCRVLPVASSCCLVFPSCLVLSLCCLCLVFSSSCLDSLSSYIYIMSCRLVFVVLWVIAEVSPGNACRVCARVLNDATVAISQPGRQPKLNQPLQESHPTLGVQQILRIF